MTDKNHCLNPNCGCPKSSGDVCCSDCATEAEELTPTSCACGHNDCEPQGSELESSDLAGEATPV